MTSPICSALDVALIGVSARPRTPVSSTTGGTTERANPKRDKVTGRRDRAIKVIARRPRSRQNVNGLSSSEATFQRRQGRDAVALDMRVRDRLRDPFIARADRLTEFDMLLECLVNV